MVTGCGVGPIRQHIYAVRLRGTARLELIDDADYKPSDGVTGESKHEVITNCPFANSERSKEGSELELWRFCPK